LCVQQTHTLHTEMRFNTVISAFAIVATGATGASAGSYSANSITTAIALTKQNYYGAPTPPWKPNHHPGWYYGKGTPPQGVYCVLEEVCSLRFDARDSEVADPLFSSCFASYWNSSPSASTAPSPRINLPTTLLLPQSTPRPSPT
jgi:hypothetical protein